MRNKVLRIALVICDKPKRFVAGLKGKGITLQQGIVGDQLAYIRTHADTLGISSEQVEELETQLGLPRVVVCHAAKNPQE